ncbi:MAG TPA: hypothetical protein PKE03_10695 [Bacteroidales bacterium]|nr:hypothetical protein [Bacteroidales bacterium]
MDDLQPPEVYEIDSVFRKYTAFDSLSFWIYLKTTTGDPTANRDTVRVLRTFKDKRFHSDEISPNGFYYQAIESTLSSRFTGLTKYELSVGKVFGNTSASDNFRLFFNNGRYYRALITNTPFGQELLLGINEGNYTTVEKIPSLTLQGRVYTDVFHTKVVDYQNAPDTAYFDFWVAKNYGLIRYQLLRPQSTPPVIDNWELVSSNLIPYTR